MKHRLDSDSDSDSPTRLPRPLVAAAVMLALPALLGARGDGCAANSTSPAPDVEGQWQVTYDDMLDVEIRIGGAVYNEALAVAGGVIEINHEGLDLIFDLDCARPEIVCPSEAWPTTVSVEQRNTQFEHRMIVTLPTQRCDGSLRTPDPSECGDGTINPDCEQVCDGAVIVSEQERFGVIGETGETFRLFLGGGIATNGFNCALLAGAVADADLETVGGPDSEAWDAVGMSAGLVTVGYAGGCLWAGDPDMDAQLEALLISASITFRTGFTGERI
jgi:hypothetical protein